MTARWQNRAAVEIIFGVTGRIALRIDNTIFGQQRPGTAGGINPSARNLGSGKIQHHWSPISAGNANTPRIGRQHALGTAVWRHLSPLLSVASPHTDCQKAFFSSGIRKGTMASGVADVADGKRRDSSGSCRRNRMAIRKVHRGNPDTTPAVNFLGISGSRHNFGCCFWVDVARLELLRILESTHHTVTFHATKTGINQVLGDLSCGFVRTTDPFKDRDERRDRLIRGDIDPRTLKRQFGTNLHWHFPVSA